jgi:hypothetical protein
MIYVAFAVALFFGVLVFTLSLCKAAADADRMAGGYVVPDSFDETDRIMEQHDPRPERMGDELSRGADGLFR